MSLLLNSAILALPLAFALWIVLRFTPRRHLNAATRYFIWWITFAVTLALPLLFVHPHRATAAGAAASDIVAIRVVQIETARSAAGPIPFGLPVQVPAWLIRYLLIAWALWSAILVARLFFNFRAIDRAQSRGVAMVPPLPVPSPVRVILASVSTPLVTGPVHRFILIPSHLPAQLSACDLNRVIFHEAAHLARRDDLAKFIERFVIALAPWHIALRFIARQIDLEREIACDDRVVESTGDACGYADCLTRVVELCGGVRQSYAAAMAGRVSHLSQRVESLLQSAGSHAPSLRFFRAAPFAAAVLLLAMLTLRAPRLVAFAAPPQATAAPHTAAAEPPALPSPDPVPAPAPVAPPVPRPAPQLPPTSQTGARHLVIYLDLLSLSPDDFDRAIAASRKFIDTKLGDTDLVAIMAAASSLIVKQDFTADRGRLRTVLENLVYDAPSGGASPDYSLAALDTAVRMLGQLKVRKSLIYFSVAPLPDNRAAYQALINDLARADVAIYAIDARGIVR